MKATASFVAFAVMASFGSALAVAILLVFAFLVRGAARQTWYRTANLHRRCSADVGAWRHGRDMGRIKNIGAGARRMRSGGSDVTDDRNGRSEHIRDDFAHAGVETARCIQTQNDNLGASLAALAKASFT